MIQSFELFSRWTSRQEPVVSISMKDKIVDFKNIVSSFLSKNQN